MRQDRLLILSDGKPGHLNQSIAFARHLDCEYDVCAVAFVNRLAKGLSFLADRFGLRLGGLFMHEPISADYRAIVSAGSETYYANRVLADRLKVKSVAIMLPKGYRYDFDLIVAQQHDNPPAQDNLVSLPINLTYVEPKALVRPESGQKIVSVVVGGDSKQGELQPKRLTEQLREVFKQFPGHAFWLTTSRRTPAAVETVLQGFDWSQAIYYSQEQINPIPDFLAHSDYVFVTADSSSMISEAVSFGNAFVEVLPASQILPSGSKFAKMLARLQQLNAVHIFEGGLGKANHKVDLSSMLKGVSL